MGSVIGHEVPVWDIAKRFGENDLLVRDAAQATISLLRSAHERSFLCAATAAWSGADVRAVVVRGVYLERNATCSRKHCGLARSAR